MENNKPAPSGETRGTPEKVCDWKAVGWTIDPKILGKIEDDPRVRAEGDPGLEMVEAILLAADWKPLAPEATTKEPDWKLNSKAHCSICRKSDNSHGPDGKSYDGTHEFISNFEARKAATVAPGEAVGRETREQPTAENPPPSNCSKCSTKFTLVQYCTTCGLEADERLSTLRRKRDQLLEKQLAEKCRSANEIFALTSLVKTLESQVRELTGAMKAQDEREAKAGELCGVSREMHGCDWPDAVAERVRELTARNEDLAESVDRHRTRAQHLADQVAELRAAVEKLREVLVYFEEEAISAYPSEFVNERVAAEFAEKVRFVLSDMRKGSL